VLNDSAIRNHLDTSSTSFEFISIVLMYSASDSQIVLVFYEHFMNFSPTQSNLEKRLMMITSIHPRKNNGIKRAIRLYIFYITIQVMN
jgi:hypothetical protein